MRQSHITFALLFISLSLAQAAPLQAEERVFTASELVAAARENNRDVRMLKAEKGLLDAEKMKAGVVANPVLGLEAATGALTGSPEENLLSIGVSQQISTGGKRDKRIAVADSELARFSARVKEQERLLTLEVKLAVQELQLAQARAGLARKTAELSNQLLQAAKERYAAGDVAELEVNLARVEVARSEGERVAAEADLAAARLALAGMVGAAPGENFRVADAEEAVAAPGELEELKALAVKNRPELLGTKLEAAQAEAELRLAQAERIPDLTAGLALTRERSETSLGGLEETETDYLLSLTLSMPIPLFDKNQAGVRLAQTRISNALAKESLQRQGVELEVEAAYGRLLASERALAIYNREIIPQLAENLKIVQEAYQLGETGIAAVIEEQKKFHEVSESRLRALQQRNGARARLEAAVGVESTEMCGGTK